MRAASAPARAFGAVLFVACATQGTDVTTREDAPSSGAGPFRGLAAEETTVLAPFVLEDRTAGYRDPAVLEDPADGTIWLYAVAARERGTVREQVIVRTRSSDGRTFFGSGTTLGARPRTVLEPDAAWEGAGLTGPTLVRNEGMILLYYAGAEGIGVSRSEDGLTFRKEPGPVLGRDRTAGTWETTEPRAPSVLRLAGGRLRMFYAAGTAIGEAESEDGLVWRRLGRVLGPAPTPSVLEGRPAFDTLSVDDPCVLARVTAAGRTQTRVLYTGRTELGSAIGFAARFGDDGPLERQRTPVYAVGRGESAPAWLERGGTSLLYVAQTRPDGASSFSAIAAGIAPATSVLPAPGDPPDSP